MADAYRDLIAWRKATDLALEIYRATQFLYRARGSMLELETQLFIAKELHYLEPLVFRRMEDRTAEWKTERKSWDES
jgi:hypothetical protein